MTVRRNDPVRCPVCPRTVERQSRQQVYCSRKCMRKGNNARKPADAFKPARHGGTGAIRNPHKSASENNVLQRPQTRSSLFCNGPLNIVGGGSWRWPGAGSLGSKTLEKIRHCEVGGELVMPSPKSEAAS